MKSLFLLIALTLCLGLSAYAQDVDKIPSITVTGIAEVQVAPDEVTFSLDVTKTDKDLQVAKRENDAVVAKILDLTRRFAVEPRNVKTDNISVSMKYDSIREAKTKIYNEDGDEIGKKVFRGYEVSKTVTVKLVDLARFEAFFGEVLNTGTTAVNSVTFTTSKLRETRDQARDMAMKAAREKASTMTAAVGQTIGKAIKIYEANASLQSYNGVANQNSVALGGTVSEPVATFAPGAIKIEAQVTVSFLLN